MSDYNALITTVQAYLNDDIGWVATGMTIEEYVRLLPQLSQYYKTVTTASGTIVGHAAQITGTVGTAATATSSTATTTVSTAVAVVPSVSETGAAVTTGVGASTAGTFGSFIVGEVLPATVAVGCGALLGVAVDTAIYQSNPDYWDEKLPTINPQTWDDIILGHDTKIPFLHNTDDGKTYIDENAFAYMAQVLQSEKFFTTQNLAEHDGVIYGYKNFRVSYVDDLPQYFRKDNHIWKIVEITESVGEMRVTNVMVSSGNTTGEYEGIGTVFASTGAYAAIREFKAEAFYDGSLHTINKRIRTSNSTGLIDDKYVTWWGEHPHEVAMIFLDVPLSTCEVVKLGDINDLYAGIAWTMRNGMLSTGQIDGVTNITGAKRPADGYISTTDTLAETTNKLKLLYPDLYNNAITVPTVQPDGTIKNFNWLPIQLPTQGTGKQPISTNATQTDNGTYPDEQAKQKAQNDTVAPGALLTPPINGNANQKNENTPSAGVGGGSATTGLGAVYVPTLAIVKQFSAWLWSNDFVDQLLKLFNNPMDAIVGLHQIYFTPTVAGNAGIQVGYLNSGVACDYTEQRYYTIDCGTLSLAEKRGNVFDYAPYTSIEIYLPFIGIVPLAVGDVMRSSINVKYTCDILTGACLATVSVKRDGFTAAMYTYGGNCACNYPLSSGSYMGIVSALAGIALNVGTAVATGGASAPLSLGGIASSVLGARTNVQTSGGFSGNTGAMGIKKPYLIIKRQFSALPDRYNEFIGHPLNKTVKLDSVSGFTQVDAIQLDGNIPSEAKAEISRLMSDGVIM